MQPMGLRHVPLSDSLFSRYLHAATAVAAGELMQAIVIRIVAMC